MRAIYSRRRCHPEGIKRPKRPAVLMSRSLPLPLSPPFSRCPLKKPDGPERSFYSRGPVHVPRTRGPRSVSFTSWRGGGAPFLFNPPPSFLFSVLPGPPLLSRLQLPSSPFCPCSSLLCFLSAFLIFPPFLPQTAPCSLYSSLNTGIQNSGPCWGDFCFKGPESTSLVSDSKGVLNVS